MSRTAVNEDIVLATLVLAPLYGQSLAPWGAKDLGPIPRLNHTKLFILRFLILFNITPGQR